MKYAHFDVMQDADVREMVKEISQVSSFPQLFIKQKFAGGLFFITDIIDQNKISTYIPMTELMLPMKDKIRNLMGKGTYMIFMKGIPNYPIDQ